jgi:leader peptidase (prepilin peptidase)/N-methyltransferase
MQLTSVVVVGVVFVAILGAIIGSFLNVVIYRVPAGKSVVAPASSCPACGHAIRVRDNLPVVSWLVLRGKCRDCGSAISPRYPLVEAGTAIFFATVAAVFVPGILAATSGVTTGASIVTLAAYLYFAAFSVALAMIDLDTHRLPNVIVLPGYGVGSVLLLVASVLSGDYYHLLPALVGAVGLGLFYLVTALIYPGGMGFGDVKLAGVIGLFLGWQGWAQLAVGALAAFILGGVFAVALVITRRAKRTTAVPFGPWMLLGAWVAVFFGAPLFSSYVNIFGVRQA